MSVLVIATAVGCALVSGIFYAFSTFVMGALGRLDAREGIRAMQSINVVVINPWAMGAMFGTALLAVASVVVATSTEGGPAAAGAVLYLVGCIGVTGTRNVPLNNELAEADAEAASSHALWQRYLDGWTRWNHVRTAASLAASIVFFAGAASA